MNSGAAVAVFEQLASEDEQRFTIVADLTEMTGYESPSHQAWQEARGEVADAVGKHTKGA